MELFLWILLLIFRFFIAPEARVGVAAFEVLKNRSNLRKSRGGQQSWCEQNWRDNVAPFGGEHFAISTGIESVVLGFLLWDRFHFNGFWFILLIPSIWAVIALILCGFYELVCFVTLWRANS